MRPLFFSSQFAIFDVPNIAEKASLSVFQIKFDLLFYIEYQTMPKNNRNGQATILETPLLFQLWDELPQPHRVITQICYYAVSRVGEVCSLQAQDRVNGYLVIRRKTTKSKQSKEVPIIPELQAALDNARLPESGYWFPADSRTRCDRKIYRINRKLSTPERNHFDVVGSKPPPSVYFCSGCRLCLEARL